MTSFLGGIASQEIIKTTGKYYPINQWKIIDFLDFSSGVNEKDLTTNIINENRYSEQISIFGEKLINKIKNAKILVAGAGALGCEIIKNIALLGVGDVKNKEEIKTTQNVIVVDNDLIELSNLNRQFLFHKENIGSSKVECACNSAKKINNQINYKPICEKLCFDSENKLSKSFYSDFDIVFSCLDNYEGKMYLDKKCTLFEIPSILGGALGPRAKTMTFIPFETACLNDIPESTKKENDEPSCTLRFYPSKIEDCIDWSRKLVYEEYFIDLIRKIKIILENDKTFFENFVAQNGNYLKSKLKFINHLFKIQENEDEKILFALDLFHELFIIEPSILLKENPLDKKNEDSTLYWNDIRRPPKILDFKINSTFFSTFIESIIHILNKITCQKGAEEEVEMQVKNFLSKNNEKNIEKILDYNNEMILNRLIENNEKQINLIIPEFNKEDILGDINFIYSCSNLRAISYSIPECDFIKTFKYVGKISPTSINPLATISGYMTLCMIAIINNKMIEKEKETKKIQLKNYTLNFIDNFYFVRDLPSLIYTEDIQNDPFFNCPIKAIPKRFNSWEKIEINGSKTIGEIIQYFKEKYNVVVSLIQADDICAIYSRHQNNRYKQTNPNQKLKKKIEEVFFEKTQMNSVQVNYIFLKISGEYDEIKVTMPLFKYYF